MNGFVYITGTEEDDCRHVVDLVFDDFAKAKKRLVRVLKNDINEEGGWSVEDFWALVNEIIGWEDNDDPRVNTWTLDSAMFFIEKCRIF